MGQVNSVHEQCDANHSGRRCKNRVRKPNIYCETHECCIGTCGKERVEGSSVCVQHTCRDCPNVVMNAGRYCYTHKCEDIGCSNARRSDRDHAQRFCRDLHACTISVCTKKRIQQWSAYCHAHKCSVEDCGAEAREEGVICAANQHTPHQFGLTELPTS